MKSTFRNRRLVVAALAAAVALPAAAWAWPGHGRGHDEHFERRIERLDLDEATRAQVEALFEEAREQRQSQREELRAAHQVLHEMLRSAESSEAALMEQAEQISELKLALQKDRIARMLALRDLIGPEQLAEILPERHRAGRGDEGCDSGRRRGLFRR